MASDPFLYAGIDLSAGRRPVTFAAVDDELEIVILARWEPSEAVSCLKEYKRGQLVVNQPTSRTGSARSLEFQDQIRQAGFEPFTKRNAERRWVEGSAQECYRAFQPRLLPRRSLEGRIQRALILYTAGLQIDDPMNYFEELTPHRLLQGILPGENIYTVKELEALVLAYLSWLAVRQPDKVVVREGWLMPAVTESD